MREAYIVAGVRTPIGKYGGMLSPVRADDLAAHVLKGALAAVPSVPAADIDDVVLGCANQAGEDNRNVARMALLLAGLPPSVPGLTVNRLCASGMDAVTHAAAMIGSGRGDVFLAGGVEHMTRAPYVLAKPAEAFGRRPEVFDTTLGWRFVHPGMRAAYGVDSMGETAENVAERFRVSREDQDRLALRSQLRAAEARRSGRLAAEILGVEVRSKAGAQVLDADEFPRPDTTEAKLAALRPAFREGGTVTAGNSSGVNDGACAMVVASEDALRRYALQPLARVVSFAAAGVEPRFMGVGPVPATRRALEAAGASLAQLDLIELNEAFAAQVLACTREFGLADDDPRLNPNGGAIALGHPLGMSGARLLLTAALELRRRSLTRALCTMCVGVGQGVATLLERA
ncbi:MAG TPA: 3-oxoadipyl-CoA thiolase [Candidatus Saccharimonadales bacterium]|nr:3-oxoadipyl-CoA thiolase [Candidatus Saccharimonadales bacterium]